MIRHLREREKTLEPFGWTREEAEWVALVCLHSGVFTRSQFQFHFRAHPMRAHRFIRRLVDLRFAVQESMRPASVGRGTKVCRITHKGIYRALEIPNVRHRRSATAGVLFRRLLSLDYVIDHPDFEWMPTEEEKVWYCEHLGVGKDRLPKRIYHGVLAGATRYFNLKFLIAGGRVTTFVYIDPGNETDTELRYWGESNEDLWNALRKLGITVHVVGIARAMIAEDWTETVLRHWTRERGPAVIDGTPEALELRRELAEVSDGIDCTSPTVLKRYGGLDQTLNRYQELTDALDNRTAHHVRIDTFELWRSERIATVGNDPVEEVQT